MTTYAPFDAADYLDNDDIIAEYLTAAAEGPNPEVFLAALGDVAKARGMAKICQERWARPREPLQSPEHRRASPL